ncbi:uncharacterized protein NEHOM01_2011 [Nematocida homosporus]|uniref:uncharacterized protein n=1 Tax=Nematocida homosporus TaxID=1912981 RepID=UPI00222106DF|nr:uncharacterized protein NEHOM01_2011 [Nematocida homosporus]KAI5187213.1 uncharacterized protein NEHOM01_2011 [Nematocida homosporus]
MDELEAECAQHKRTGNHEALVEAAGNLVNYALRLAINGERVEKTYKHIVDALSLATQNITGSRYKNTAYSEAFVVLGKIHETGIITEPNLKKAYICYKRAAEYSSPFGCYRLAYFYEHGIACRKNLHKAGHFYKLAANGGSLRAVHKYAMLLLEGCFGCRQDIKGGVFYLEQARQLSTPEYPHALYDLGLCHEGIPLVQGHIIEDYPYSLALYQEGEKLGCPRSILRLGLAYHYGELGLEANQETAKTYYTRIAEVSPQACFEMFKLERNADNKNESIDWVKQAAQLGHPDAAAIYAAYLDTRNQTHLDKKEAKWWYTIAESRGAKVANK